MNILGLTEERYNQLLSNGNEIEDIEELINSWGVEIVNKGYDIFDYDGTGLLDIERIDEIGAFNTDKEATEQAIKDGIKIIPISELPINLCESMKFYGWIDTPENRKALEVYAIYGRKGK